MAYCEAAGKECGYLQLVESVRSRMVLDRVDPDIKTAARATQAADVTDDFAEQQIHCEDDYCGIIGWAIAYAMKNEVNRK